MNYFFELIKDVLTDAAFLACALALFARAVRIVVNVVSGKGLHV